MTDLVLISNIIDITNMYLNGQITKEEMADQIVIILHNNGRL